MTTAFDKLDYHVDGARQAGQPEEHAFTHIGLYLAWLVRHDLHNTEFIRDDWVAAVKAGEMTGSDLTDAIDGTLVADLMTPEGAAFTGAYYDTYLEEYAEVFASEAHYAVPDNPDTYGRIAPVIDRRYADWVAHGRPQPPRHETDVVPPSISGFDRRGDMALKDLREMAMDEFHAIAADEGWVVETQPAWDEMPHHAADLENLIARVVTQPGMVTSSVDASQWGDALLKRALKRLGVQLKDSLVANGIGGEGVGTVTATLYAVPKVGATDLEREFASVIHLPPRGRWESRDAAGKRVHWSAGREFHVAFWALDGLVVHASASDAARLEQLVSQLP